MKIAEVSGAPSFGRRPSVSEMPVYTRSLNAGLKLLDKKVDLILHNSSAPAIRSENTGIGSLFSRTTVTKLFPFLKRHAFSNIQQEPNSLRKPHDNSPYAPEANSRNIFMIPLEKLASDEYNNILSKETFNKIVRNNPSEDRVDYDYVRKNYDIALREAFENAKDSDEFLKFKEANEAQYEQDAIYRILSKKNGNTGWRAWNKTERTLYSDNTPENARRIADLKEKFRDEYDLYLFEQMILEKENKISNELSAQNGIRIIGDSPVASSDVEEWVNQKLFLKGKAIGCPPDYFSPDGQRWGFSYYDPEKLFNKDGSLGEAGKIMKKKYENYFASFPGGIRIDHVIGLVDPFIYTKASKTMTEHNSGRIYSVPGKYQKHTDEEYASILSKIVIPAAQKYGLDKSALICEDLGDRNIPTERVMKYLDLSGLAVTQFNGYRGSEVPAKNTIMLGSHDNPSYLQYTDNFFKDKGKEFETKTAHLALDTSPKDASLKDKTKYMEAIRRDKKSFIAASFAELFTSPARRIQIFFTDFFGIPKTYNTPGTEKGNWELRLGENFEEEYYRAASEGWAPNFPKAIAAALRQRGLDKSNESLMKDLDNFARIIDEKV